MPLLVNHHHHQQHLFYLYSSFTSRVSLPHPPRVPHISMSANNSSATIGEQTGPDLDLVEALVNPRASDALLGEFIAQIVLGLLVSLTGCFIILLKFIKALRSHRAGLPRPYADLWLVRRLHKPKGTYIVTNSILIWTITEVCCMLKRLWPGDSLTDAASFSHVCRRLSAR